MGHRVMTLSDRINAFLAEPAIAIAGVSRSNKKFGSFAFRELRSKGYRVYPIHPTATSIDGVTCYPHFADLPERVSAALIVVPSHIAVDVVREAAAAGVRRVWLQQGAESPQLLALCDELGLETVSGQCILMFANPGGYHRVHRWINGLLGQLPAGTIAHAPAH